MSHRLSAGAAALAISVFAQSVIALPIIARPALAHDHGHGHHAASSQKAADHHHATPGHAAPGMQATQKVGDIQIHRPYARATPAKVGGVFMILQNAGGAADKLIKAASPVAENVELHTNVKDGETMRMRQVEAIEIPAQGRTELAPGGYHVMLIGLKQALKEGGQFPLTLTFEKAGSVTLEVPVTKAGASGGHHHH
jgi:copper(I)-binding protein